MNEPITKVCEICKGVGHWFDAWGRVDCSECDHTGRVPDVEATLRSEVARRTEELADTSRIATERWVELLDETSRADWAITKVEHLAAQLAERDSALATARAEVERLTVAGRRAEDLVKAADNVIHNARLLGSYAWEDRLDDSEVSKDARSDARKLSVAVWHYDQKSGERAAWLAGCKS